MPQMMPINWMTSFILFIIIFILFNIINYFIVNYKSPQIKHNTKYYNNPHLWKW